MTDPIVSKAASRGLDSAAKPADANPAKLGESKFDQVRSLLLGGQTAQVRLLPEVKQVSLEQRKKIQADLAEQVERNGAASTQKLIGVQMNRGQARIEQLTT